MNLAKLTEKRSPIPGLVIMAVVVGLVWLNASTGSDDPPTAAPTPPAVAAPASSKPEQRTDLAGIVRAYVDNEAAASAKYVDAPIITAGQVERITGTPENALLYLGQPGQPNVHAAAWMDASASEAVLAMKRGDVIGLRCRGDLPIGGRIMFRHCAVVTK